MDLGPHASFILTSYVAVIGVIAALIGWLFYDGRRQQAALAALEARGIKRRGSTHA
jgi:heme exporter protein D